MVNSLIQVAATEKNENWENIIKREEKLYSRDNDIRSDFERDYTRIIHSSGFRRMKHKTQVFFSPSNDHICTRIEHVIHVESISYTIAKYLGLNTQLTKAIAISHDIGHSPFGHKGEKVLSKILEKDVGETLWHEKNGLDMVDKIELLEDPYGKKQNMNLTYAVRDGIISHCGEIDENNLRPRSEFIDLNNYDKPNKFAPYTWEGCVVKIADKISYLGRDIADAITLGIMDDNLDDLYKILDCSDGVINNTVIINDFIYDLCRNSSIENGLCFSSDMLNKINKLKKFNYEKIYYSKKLEISFDYFSLILTTIYDLLKETFFYKDDIKRDFPKLVDDFEKWLKNYWTLERNPDNANKAFIETTNLKDYCKAVIYYISGMTDNYAIDMYNKIIGF